MASEIESRIIQSFSKHVKTYDRHAQLQKSMAERLASLLPTPLPPKIIELGCGTGIFTRHLLARGARDLVLNDIAPAMMDHLKAQMSVPMNTLFISGNAEQVSFPKTHLIAGNAVFQWFQSPGPTLQRLAGRLLKNGTLVFSTFGPKTLQEFREIAHFQGPTPLMAQREWRRFLRAANFKVVEFQDETREIFFPGTRNLLRNLQQIGAAPLPVFRAGGLRKTIEEYDRKFTTPQGVYTHWELLYFRVSH